MASVFGHAIVGATLAKTLDDQNSRLLLLLAISSAILPDLDVLAFNFGIPYAHPLGHRGFTHSIAFALVWAFILMILFGKRQKLIWFLVIFMSTLSHGILDAMTSGGEGVGFLIPFNSERYFFPFREIIVSPLGIERFFSDWGLRVIYSELKYIFIPCLLILLVRFLIIRLKK